MINQVRLLSMMRSFKYRKNNKISQREEKGILMISNKTLEFFLIL